MSSTAAKSKPSENRMPFRFYFYNSRLLLFFYFPCQLDIFLSICLTVSVRDAFCARNFFCDFEHKSYIGKYSGIPFCFVAGRTILKVALTCSKFRISLKTRHGSALAEQVERRPAFAIGSTLSRILRSCH